MADYYEKQAPEKYEKAVKIVQKLIDKAKNLVSRDTSIRLVLVRLSKGESTPHLSKRSLQSDCPQTFQDCMS
jgi:hypothetical protein